MKFNSISDKLTPAIIKMAELKFSSIIVELGVRDTNTCVGSGLGGNNFQLLVLMSMDHALISGSSEVIVTDSQMIWGADWLIYSKKDCIRQQIDKVFKDVSERYKYMPLVMNEHLNGKIITTDNANYTNAFVQVDKAVDGQDYEFDKLATPLDRMIIACLMCQRLSEELDANILKNVQNVGKVLIDFPSEIILFAVRRYIRIHRLIKHNLDEDKIFGKVIQKVYDEVE